MRRNISIAVGVVGVLFLAIFCTSRSEQGLAIVGAILLGASIIAESRQP